MTNVLWGWIGDRAGHKIVLVLSVFLLALAALIAWSAESEISLIVAFILLGASISGDGISRFSIVLEFAVPEDHPTYIGLTNTLLAPIVALGPVLGGWLATVLDYPGMFLTSAVISLVGGVMLLVWVREPRKVTPVAIGSNLAP